MAISAPLAPYARQWAFNLGLIAPGALLHTYAGGTVSTPRLTYADSARTIPNANPIVASPAGLFGPLFLIPDQSYHMVLETAVGVTIWDQDNVGAPREGSFTTAALGPISDLAIPPGTTLLRCDNASLLTLSGMTAGSDGQRIQIVSVGACNDGLPLVGACRQSWHLRLKRHQFIAFYDGI